ncbi:unnamed protein product [Ambrosiozyma monospora]|uniref:Unnamed protein product n=1 Tax=Ambrosiozyma monospora TaxID=43982 RepID=A0ACB5T3C9_AMBMO|nr:unnamed protein product [Ambrosiozyma monospora]
MSTAKKLSTSILFAIALTGANAAPVANVNSDSPYKREADADADPSWSWHKIYKNRAAYKRELSNSTATATSTDDATATATSTSSEATSTESGDELEYVNIAFIYASEEDAANPDAEPIGYIIDDGEDEE